jgi:hypothetical protein
MAANRKLGYQWHQPTKDTHRDARYRDALRPHP